MNIFFAVLIIIISILLILIVLVQNSKGGGLASNFASSNQFMGVRKTADFLEKATWTLAGALLLLCLLSSITYKSASAVPQSAIEGNVRNTPAPGAVQHYPINSEKSSGNTTAPAAGQNNAAGTQSNAPQKK